MKLATAKKILEHYLGADNVKVTDRELIARYNGQIFSSYLNYNGRPDEIGNLHVRGENEHDMPQADYFAGSYFDSMPAVIRCFLNRSYSIFRDTEVEGTDESHRFWLRFNVRMEGSGTKMRPVVYVEAELRLLNKQGYWPLAGEWKGKTADATLLSLIDEALATKDSAYEGIILDRTAETLPDAYALYEQLLSTPPIAV